MAMDHVDDFIVDAKLIDLKRRKKWREMVKERFENDMARIKKLHCDAVIFTCEHFHSRLKTEAEVEALKALLSPFFDDFEIIGYLRRQDQLASSLYSTYLKVGGFSRDMLIPDIVKDDDYYDFMRLYKKWSNVFGKSAITFRRYDKDHFFEGEIRKDFLKAVGINDGHQFSFGNDLNTKISGNQQLFGRYLTSSSPMMMKKTVV